MAVSGKKVYDEVSKNAQWEERINKELSTQTLNTEFTLNPKLLNAISDKPNAVKPSFDRFEGEVDEKTLDLILAPHRTPHEKYKKPQTSSQEIGWDDVPVRKNARFHHGRSTCDITTYADAYVTMAGKSPFATKAAK